MIQQHPTVSDVKTINKVLREAKKRPSVSLKYVKLDKKAIVMLSDASFAGNHDGSTTGGFLVMLCEPNQPVLDSDGVLNCFKSSIIEWKAQKLKRVTRSTLASETLAASEGLDMAIFVQSLFCEIFAEKLPVHAFSDSKSLVQAAHSSKGSLSEKMLLVNLSAIRQFLSNGTVSSFSHIPTKLNLSDYMTKYIPNKERLFVFLRSADLRLPFEFL